MGNESLHKAFFKAFLQSYIENRYISKLRNGFTDESELISKLEKCETNEDLHKVLDDLNND